jgi:ribonuclease HII
MTTRYENKKFVEGYTHVIGCDEVGRGCLAGPVVAAAVMLPPVESEKWKVIKSVNIRDSKQLSPEQRVKAAEIIKQHFLWGIGMVDEKKIDEINIHHASLLAMRRAVEHVSQGIEGGSIFLFVDGKFPVPNVGMEQEAVVGGDNKVLSVAAASIVAKVYRDELMQKLHKQYPIYNFSQHKGYATQQHRDIILEYGLTNIHRLSFCEHLV